MENTSRPWVLVTLGMVAFLSVGVLFKRARSNEDDAAARAERLARAIAEQSEGGTGWASQGSGGAAGVGGDASPEAKEGRRGGIDSAGSEGARAAGRGYGAGLNQKGGGPGATGGLDVGSNGAGLASGSAAERLARRSREARARASQPVSALLAGDPASAQETSADTPVYKAFEDGKLDVDSENAPLAADKVESKDGFVMFEGDSQVVVPNAGNLSGPSGSISFWVKPSWDGSEATDAHMLDLSTPNVWENRLAVNKNGRYLRFMFFPNTGVEVGVSSIIDQWRADQQHHVVASWGPRDGGGNTLELYVDGILMGTEQYDGELEIPTDQSLILGNNRSGRLGARGGMSGVELYPNRISPEKVITLRNSRLR